MDYHRFSSLLSHLIIIIIMIVNTKNQSNTTHTYLAYHVPSLWHQTRSISFHASYPNHRQCNAYNKRMLSDNVHLLLPAFHAQTPPHRPMWDRDPHQGSPDLFPNADLYFMAIIEMYLCKCWRSATRTSNVHYPHCSLLLLQSKSCSQWCEIDFYQTTVMSNSPVGMKWQIYKLGYKTGCTESSHQK